MGQRIERGQDADTSCQTNIASSSAFSEQTTIIDDIDGHMFVADLWNETTAQEEGFIVRNVHFPQNRIDTIYSGPHIGCANPIFSHLKGIVRHTEHLIMLTC